MGAFHPYPVHPARPEVAYRTGASCWGPPPPIPTVTDNKAVASVLLGLLSLACIGPFAGLPAIVLGAMARRDIERSNGLLVGRGLAAGGIVAGLFGTGFGVVAALWVVGAVFAPDGPDADATQAEVPRLLAPSIGDNARADTDQASHGGRVPSGTRSYGSLEVVDLDDARPLRAQLSEILARSRGRTVLLQTYVRSSQTCAAIAASLPDTRMQGALANVTIVRVDVEEYPRDLGAMKIDARSAPWFYRLDGRGDPMDGLSAENWETPESMAPLLGWFVHRPSTSRRARP